jgi:hypothetical protein
VALRPVLADHLLAGSLQTPRAKADEVAQPTGAVTRYSP